jgi:hypothetical protein
MQRPLYQYCAGDLNATLVFAGDEAGGLTRVAILAV